MLNDGNSLGQVRLNDKRWTANIMKISLWMAVLAVGAAKADFPNISNRTVGSTWIPQTNSSPSWLFMMTQPKIQENSNESQRTKIMLRQQVPYSNIHERNSFDRATRDKFKQI